MVGAGALITQKMVRISDQITPAQLKPIKLNKLEGNRHHTALTDSKDHVQYLLVIITIGGQSPFTPFSMFLDHATALLRQQLSEGQVNRNRCANGIGDDEGA